MKIQDHQDQAQQQQQLHDIQRLPPPSLLQQTIKVQQNVLFDEQIPLFKPGTFPLYDFSLFSYMKIHQRQHIRFPKAIMNQAVFGNSRGLAKGSAVSMYHSDRNYTNHLLNQIISYVILPQSVKVLFSRIPSSKPQNQKEKQPKFLQKSIRTDFLSQKVILLDCQQNFKVVELQKYMEIRMKQKISSQGGEIKPMTLRKYLQSALQNLIIISIENIIEMGSVLTTLGDIIQRYPIVALVVATNLQWIDLSNFLASDVKSKKSKSSVQNSNYQSNRNSMTQNLTDRQNEDMIKQNGEKELYEFKMKKRRSTMALEQKDDAATPQKLKSLTNDILKNKLEYVKKVLQPRYHFAFIFTKMERALCRGKYFRDVIYSSQTRLDIKTGQDHVGDYLSGTSSSDVLVINMSERYNEARNVSILRRKKLENQKINSNNNNSKKHQFQTVNLSINQNKVGEIIPEYDTIQQVRFTYEQN